MANQKRIRNRIVDARGRAVTQLDPVLMHLLRRHAVIPAEPLREIAEQLDRKWAKWAYAIALLNAGCLALCWAGMTYYMLALSSRGRFDQVTILICAFQLVLMLGGFLFSWRLARGRRFDRAGPVMLKHRRCPHCGYDLRGLSIDPDDSAVCCPECGCAWRINDAALADYAVAAADHPANESSKRGKTVVLASLVLLTLGLVAFAWVGARQMRAARLRAVGAPVAAPVAVQPPAVPAGDAEVGSTVLPDEE
jgi:hypothetical protein